MSSEDSSHTPIKCSKSSLIEDIPDLPYDLFVADTANPSMPQESKYLDMPSLDDIKASELDSYYASNSLFMTPDTEGPSQIAFDDSYLLQYPCTVGKENSSCNYPDADDVSEFLIFNRAVSALHDDRKLKSGCCVKLNRINHEPHPPQRIKIRRLTKAIDRYCASPPKMKRCHSKAKSLHKSLKKCVVENTSGTNAELSGRTKSTKKKEDFSRLNVKNSSEENRKIILKFVRSPHSHEYKCIFVSDGRNDQNCVKRKRQRQRLEDSESDNVMNLKRKRRESIVDTKVLVKPEIDVVKDGAQSESANLAATFNVVVNCDKKMDEFLAKSDGECAVFRELEILRKSPRSRGKGYPEKTDIENIPQKKSTFVACAESRPVESVTNSPITGSDDYPLDLTLRKIENRKHSVNESVAVPMELTESVDKRSSPVRTKLQSDRTPDNNLQESSKPLRTNFREIISIENTFNIGESQLSEDESENSSVCSELSIFAPSLADLESPKAKHSKINDAVLITNESSTLGANKFRIPKINRNVAESTEHTNAEKCKNSNFVNYRECRNETPLEDIYRRSSSKPNDSSTEVTKSIPLNVDLKTKRNKKMEKESVKIPKNKHAEKQNVKECSNGKPEDSNDKAVRHSKQLKKNEDVTVEATRLKESPVEKHFEPISNNSKIESTKSQKPNQETKIIRENIRIQFDQTNNRNILLHGLLPNNGSQQLQDASIKIEHSKETADIQKPIPTIQAPMYSFQTTENRSLQPQMQGNLSSTPTTQNSLKPQNELFPTGITHEMRRIFRSRINMLFEFPCYSFLRNRQCIEPCKFKHQLPPIDVVSQRMSQCQNDVIQFAYMNFIVKYSLSFIMYFPLICQIYGNRKLHSLFSGLIADCERFDKQEYFKSIFDGLVQCGIHRKNALLQIVSCCQTNNASSQAIIKIIETDPQSFTEIISKYAPKLDLSSQLLTQLLQQVVNNAEVSRLSDCIHILDQIGPTIFNIDNDVLNNFCAKVFALNEPNLSTKILTVIANSLQQ